MTNIDEILSTIQKSNGLKYFEMKNCQLAICNSDTILHFPILVIISSLLQNTSKNFKLMKR